MGLGNTEVERDLIGTKDCGACPQIAFPQKVYSFLCVCVCAHNVVLS